MEDWGRWGRWEWSTHSLVKSEPATSLTLTSAIVQYLRKACVCGERGKGREGERGVSHHQRQASTPSFASHIVVIRADRAIFFSRIVSRSRVKPR
jgi:hypothetical protein